MAFQKACPWVAAKAEQRESGWAGHWASQRAACWAEPRE